MLENTGITGNKVPRVSKEIKQIMTKIRNSSVQQYLSGLTATESTNDVLRKASHDIKKASPTIPLILTPNSIWAQTNQGKATALINTLKIQPLTINSTPEGGKGLYEYLNAPHLGEFMRSKTLLLRSKTSSISKITKEALGFDLITGQILQQYQ